MVVRVKQSPFQLVGYKNLHQKLSLNFDTIYSINIKQETTIYSTAFRWKKYKLKTCIPYIEKINF